MLTPTELDAARVAPETLPEFRAGQLLLLLGIMEESRLASPGIDRLGYYEFFTANPFLVVEPRSPDGLRLLAQGFHYQNLDYQSSSQRYANRRARLQRDLTILAARGLVETKAIEGRVAFHATADGVAAARALHAMYAVAYRASAAVILGRLKRLSDSQLRTQAAAWLKAEALLIDLYDV